MMFLKAFCVVQHSGAAVPRYARTPANVVGQCLSGQGSAALTSPTSDPQVWVCECLLAKKGGTLKESNPP